MPSINWTETRSVLLVILAGVERYYARLCILLAQFGFVLVVLSGELLAVQAFLTPWLPIHWLRQFHMLAGLLVLLILLTRVVFCLHWLFRKIVLRQSRPASPPPSGTPTGGRLLNLLESVFWIVTALMIFSGLQRYAGIEHGVSLPPTSSSLWWPLHGTLRPLFYAFLLLIFVNHGKIFVKRALNYLRSP